MSWRLRNSIRFAALGNSNDSQAINSAWENVKEKVKTSATECLGLFKLKKNKPCFDEECLLF
jgi:hypothetical protein